MGVKLLLFGVIYQTIITTTLGAVKLPFTDLVATVTPLKPTPTSLPSASTGVPKSNDAILEYFKSQYLDNDLSDIECEYSSPLMLTTKSRALPIPKIDTFHSLDGLRLSSTLNIDPSITLTLSAPTAPRLCETNFDCKPKIFLPDISSPNGLSLSSTLFTPSILPSLPKLYKSYPPRFPQRSCPTDSAITCNNVPSYPVILSSPTPALNRSPFLSFTNSLSLPTVNSLPIVPLEPLKDTIIETIVPVSRPTNNILAPTSKISYSTMSSLNPLYSVPYPLRYNQLSLPKVITPNINPSLKCTYFKEISPPVTENFILPISFSNPYLQVTNLPLVTPQTYITAFKECPSLPNSECIVKVPPLSCATTPVAAIRTPLADLNRISKLPSIYPTKTISEVDPFDFKPIDFDFESTPCFVNNLNTNVDYSNNFGVPNMFPKIDAFVDAIDYNFGNNLRNLQASFPLCTAKIPSNIPEFIPIQNIDTLIPDISLPPLPSEKLFANVPVGQLSVLQATNIPEISSQRICYPPKVPQASVVPATYINISPSYSLAESCSNAVSSINNIVTNMSQNILSYVTFLLTSKSGNPLNKLPTNPYGNPMPKPAYSPTCTYPTFNTKSTCPSLPTIALQPKNLPTIVPIKTPTSANFASLDSTGSTLSMVPSLNTILTAQYNEYPTPSLTSYSSTSDSTSQASNIASSEPVKVTILPPATFADYSPPQPCPSILPSPMIPSFMTAPIVVEPQVVKLNSFDKKTKSIERLLELVFLAGYLYGDEYIDWDALDAVLAIMCAS